MSRRYILIGVEGNHDQAFIGKILQKLLGFSQFEGSKSELDKLLETKESIWHEFIPSYPNKTLYKRLDMPSIFYNDDFSVAIYVGEGSKLISNLKDKLSNISDYSTSLSAFAIVVDADEKTPAEVVKIYHDGLQEYFPDFPTEVSATGTVIESTPRLGLYVLPNNADQGVLDTILYACGEVAYPEYMARAKSYVDQFSEEEIKQIKWKPFDKEKATIATVASILQPGMTNTVTIARNKWVSLQTERQIPYLQNLTHFLRNLLSIEIDSVIKH